MNQERSKRIDELLQQAIELEGEALAQFLDEACAGDAGLRREVADMLRREAATGEILKHSPMAGSRGKTHGDALRAGERIGHYLIEARIARGGMGEIWRALDEQLKREVAIKILPPEFSSNSDRVRRFEQEALTVSRLNHSNIITIHDIGRVASEFGDLHFIVTELIEGRTLREILNRERPGWREAVLISAQIAGALNVAHTVGIIHRDIKPENIMALANGHVKVLDFGIAKWVSVSPVTVGAEQPIAELMTGLGAQPGTLKYMSPEQARGDELDARTDVFSLGLILYEMLAGRHPYDSVSSEEFIAALKSADEITSLSEADDRIPAALIRIVARALRKERDERYASAGEMLADLNHLKSLIKVGGGEKETQALKAQSADQLLTRFVVFHDANGKTLIPPGMLWTIWRSAGLKRGRLERELIRKSLIGGLGKNGWRVLLIAALTLGSSAWLSTTEYWTEQSMSDGHTAARRAAFSPDGRLLVSVGEDNRVIVWDFARREQLATFDYDHTDRVTTVEFSPDGKWFVTASADGSIIVWDAVRLAKAAVLPGQQGVVRAIAFSADGCVLVTPTNDDTKNIWEVGSWKKLREVKTSGFRFGHFLLSSDGRWLMTPFGYTWDLVQERLIDDKRPYFWSGITPRSANTRPPFWSWAARAPDGRRMISIDAGGFVSFTETDQFETPERRNLTGHFRSHSDSGRAVAFSHDGKLAASGADDIVLWDALTQKKIVRFKPKANVASLDFSPKGDYLVSAHVDGSILAWDTNDRELAADFKEHFASIEAVAFARTGNRLATAGEDRSIIVWNAKRGNKEAVLLWHPIRITALAFSNDGQWLASNDLDGNLALWEVSARRLRWSITEIKRTPSEGSYCVAISPDGRWVATSYGVYETGGGRLIYDFRTEDSPPPLGFPQPTEVRSLAFSADGQWLVSVTARGDIVMRRPGDWQVSERHKLNGKHLVSVSLSPDGRRLATGEDEGSVRLWQTHPLRQAAVIGHHQARIKSVAFSPDGEEVVSAGDDKMIALWDVAGRKLITRIGQHTAPVCAVAFSPDGKQLISGGRDHSVRLYTRRRSLWGWRLD